MPTGKGKQNATSAIGEISTTLFVFLSEFARGAREE
jgi:hypothetical protein